MLSLNEVATLTEAEVICGIEQMKREVKFGFASDLLSDVLTLSVDNLLFITGLSNLQTIRTAEMADIGQILFVRGKKVTPEMCALAKENNIVLLTTTKSLFYCAGVLRNAGMEPVY